MLIISTFKIVVVEQALQRCCARKYMGEAQFQSFSHKTKIFWNRMRVLLTEFFPKGATLSGAAYVQTLA